MIRCKFRVLSVTDYGNSVKSVKLTAQYDETIPEDGRFAAATPTGTFEATITNPKALEELTPGREFYVDLTPVSVS